MNTDPRRRTYNPESGILDPRPQNQDPEPRVQHLGPGIQDQRSKTKNPDFGTDIYNQG